MVAVAGNEMASAASAAAATEEDKGGSVRWDRFLPRASVRVMLVESDHSTREIVSALLSKCGYLVSSAGDGLKAWEMLKANSQEVDLVLTEVELPSLSGLDLLTLIMDHDVCRNIPVVMMSASDSIATVFKCMRKGAADFLVKPIRKNELRILWQHVWRRYSSNSELGLANRSGGDVPDAERKSEANSDNNAASNRFREPGAGVVHKECDEKESDTQSSSTRPSRDVESSFVKNTQELCQDNLWSSIENDSRGSATMNGCAQHKSDGVKTSSEVIDLLGVMRNIHQDVHTVKKGNAVACNTSVDPKNFVIGDKPISHVTSAPHLELSLGGYESQNCANPGTAGCNVLNHSNSSAFSRYSGRTVSPKSVNLEKQEEYFSKPNHTDQRLPPNNSASEPEMKIQFNGEETTSTVTSCCNQDGEPIQMQAPGDSNGVSTTCDQQSSFGSSMVPNVSTQQGDPPWRKQPITHKVVPIKYPGQSNPGMQNPHESAVRHLSYQAQTEKIKNSETDETVRHLSSSMCSSNNPYLSSNNPQGVCNGITVHLNTNTSANGTAANTQDNFQLTDGQCPTTNLQRSIRREAALTKFRLKRKDRCYEKKVRYHSRQKLAEQRPRVKGQFVRKVQPDNENGSG